MKKIELKVIIAVENAELFSQTINVKDKILKAIDNDNDTWESLQKAIMESEIPASDKTDFIKWIDETNVNDLYDYFSIELSFKTYHLDSDTCSGFIVPVIFNTNMMYVKYLQELHEREVES